MSVARALAQPLESCTATTFWRARFVRCSPSRAAPGTAKGPIWARGSVRLLGKSEALEWASWRWLLSSDVPGKTSERIQSEHYVTNEGDYLIYVLHLATYDFTQPFVTGKRVLDFGCGTGYGTHRIAPWCASVTGVDVSEEATGFAHTNYQHDSLSYQRISPVEVQPLPFADESFDVVLSFQVLEHVPDTARYLAEARRVLRRDGLLILATPDRSTRLLRGQRPWNGFHLDEWSGEQLRSVLSPSFETVDMNSMTAPRQFLNRELRRTAQLRWMTLPFTFPGAPERWRLGGLGVIKRMEAVVRRKPATSNGDGERFGDPAARYGYDESAVVIAPGVAPSVNLVAVARPRRQGVTTES